jgi:hypothetical protein
MFIRILILSSSIASAATFSVVPAFNSDCALGLGTATLTWSGATGLVEIRVGQPNGPALTAFTNPSGSAVTGRWVTDGMTFYLVDQAGTVEASVTAHLSCGGTPRTIDQGLSGGSYFPLAVGNTWIYKYNNRFVTGDYVVYSITDTEIIGGQTYYVLSYIETAIPATLALLRVGANGIVYQNVKGVDQAYFDPSAAQRTGYSGPLGSFDDALQVAPPDLFVKTTSTYVRGIGLVNARSTSLTGSNGGFLDGLDLIDVRVDGIHLSVPAPNIGLSIENTDLDLTNQLVPNCAVPCYYPACGIGSPYDQPGVYRPCAQTRIETSSTAGYTVLLQLLDPTGTVLFENSTPALTATTLDYIRLPLYTQTGSYNPPFTLLPPGDYKLVGSIVSNGTPQAQSSINVHIH